MAMENIYSLDCSFRMSDILNRLGQEKFKGHLQFNVNQSLSYVRHSCISASEHLVTVHVGYDTLKHWYKVKMGSNVHTSKLLMVFFAIRDYC